MEFRARVLSWAVVGVLALAGPALATPVIVVDFLQAAEGNQVGLGTTLGAMNLKAWGFTDSDYGLVTAAVMAELNEDYLGIPTSDVDSDSPIPAGQELDITFMTGTRATVPAASDYYYVLVGTCVSGTYCTGTTVGVGIGDAVRDIDGAAGGFDGWVVADVFTNVLNGMGGLDPSDALTGGHLGYTANVIAGTLAHEIGHTLSLDHVLVSGAHTVTGTAPLMGTGALDLSNQARLFDRSFAYSADLEGHTAQQQDVQQLINALDLRDEPEAVPEPVTLALAAAGLLGMIGCCGARTRACGPDTRVETGKTSDAA